MSVTVTQQNFREAVLQNERAVLLDFGRHGVPIATASRLCWTSWQRN